MVNSKAAEARSRMLYAAAQEAMQRDDGARAYALLEELLPLLEPAGELRSQHVVLGQMGKLLAEAGSYTLAIERWCQAVPLAEAQGDLNGASLLLDKVARLYADQGAWRRALSFWEQALALDTRLDHAPNRAATLTNLALAAGHVGDKLRADRCWSEALDLFEASGLTSQALAIARAMQSVALTTHDHSDPLGLRARVLAMAEAAGSVGGQIAALDGMAHEALQHKKHAGALRHWERALILARNLDDARTAAQLADNIAQCQAELRGELRIPQEVPPDSYSPNVSEYAVPANAGPFFLVGELWADLHARGLSLRALETDAIRVGPAGVARVSANARLTTSAPFDPESAASDLKAALASHSRQRTLAILAGYARRGYELLDRRQPDFTDQLLDRLGVPRPRLGSRQAVDNKALLVQLGAELHVDRGKLTLAVSDTPGPSAIWQSEPQRAFVFVLALLVAGVDCRALWAREAVAPWPTLKLLLPRDGTAPDAEAETARLIALVPPGLGLAAALAASLRYMRYAEPLDFNVVVYWARKVLTEGADQEALDLGDSLLDVTLYCANLLDQTHDSALASYLQKASILLEYTVRGQPSDEGRLLLVTRALYALPEAYPLPLEPWPQDHGPWLWQWNSHLLALREIAEKSLAAQERGQMGMLRSAALRGVRAARHVLRISYAGAHSRDPEVATSSLLLMKVTIKNYALLLSAFLRSVEIEQANTGDSAWLPWLVAADGETHMVRELAWVGGLYEAAATEGFSLDVARPFMRAGVDFYAEERSFFVLPHLPTN
jgi:tetratricopeptide (TPR) repeat protein